MGTTETGGRVVVADDSRLMRRMLADALGRQGFEVVGAAADGDEALELCRVHRPDALTLDLHMPGLDGLGVLRALRDGKAEPVPVVVVSAFSPAHGAYAVDALAEGAFDLVAKPALGEPLETFTSELGRKVGEAAHASRVRRPAPPAAPRRPAPAAARVRSQTPRLGAGGLLVQHMPAGFTASLAARLDGASAVSVREARSGELLERGSLLVA